MILHRLGSKTVLARHSKLSELDNGFILNLAKKYNLEVFPLRKKIGIKRFQNEVLVVNYDVQPYNLWRQ